MTNLISYQSKVNQGLQHMAADNILPRIWARDHTVWKPEPTEISNRLGWLDIAQRMLPNRDEIQGFVESVQKDGYTHALLLGMGGSSLAPEMFRKVFGVKPGYLDLSVLDSTDPGAVLAYARSLNLPKTLFIVSTKSGGTVETFSFMRFFYNRLLENLGTAGTGRHFIAITDPGSQLEETASQYNFRHTFINDPNIGGRYSALSYFGLVPAALLGVDLKELLIRAQKAMQDCCASIGTYENSAAKLGITLGESAKSGRDKLTLVLSPSIASFGDWLEQLIAESTGKEGKGIPPVVGEELLEPAFYGIDRLFVHIELEADADQTNKLKAIEDAGFPVMHIKIKDTYDLGVQIFIWELATALAGYSLGINPFDQPNVESAKALAREMVAVYKKDGKLPDTAFESPNKQTLEKFLAETRSGVNYVALQAYLMPSSQMNEVLHKLRTSIQSRYRVATTVGYGPRFLHSTGQLHKGDGGQGFFIQFIANQPEDAIIPDGLGKPESSLTFGILEKAQAMGDAQALKNNKRKVIRFNLGGNPICGISSLLS